jgi:WASH complex subunit strumpellin
MNKVENLMLPLLKFMRIIGQGQLIRRQIAFLLQFNCQMDAHLLYQSLDTFNHTLMNEIRRHYHEPKKYSYPSSDNMILYETTVMMMMMMMDDG